MVNDRAFRIAADEILDDGRHPTYEAIRQRLSGGSFSDFKERYEAWSLSREYRPRPTKKDLPAHLMDELAKAAAGIWAEGRWNQALELRNRCDELTRTCSRLATDLDEQRALVAALERRLVLEAGKPDMHVAASASVQSSHAVPQASGDIALDNPAAETGPNGPVDLTPGFWPIAMEEVHGILDGKRLKPIDIIKLLRNETLREANVRDKAFRKPGRLASLMRAKSDLFTELHGGFFCRHGQCSPEEIRTDGPAKPRPAKAKRPQGRPRKRLPEPHGVLRSM